MSRRAVGVLAIFLAVVCGAAAFVWLHAGGQNKTTVNFTPEPAANPINGANPSQHEGIRTQPEATPSGSAKPLATAAAEPAGFTPPTGEVLEFSGSVAKVNNV